MAAEKLAEAMRALAAAPSAPRGLVQDQAGDALTLCRRAFNQSAKELKATPELLDTSPASGDIPEILRCLVLCCEKKARKAQVKECVKLLFERPIWLQQAAADEATRQFFVGFLAEYPDMADIATALEDPSIADARAAAAAEAAAEVARAKAFDEAADAALSGEAADHTRSLLRDGLAAMRKCDFVYPTDASDASDAALEGFRLFYRGIARLHTIIATARGRAGVAVAPHEALLRDIHDQDWPRALGFLATVFTARHALRGQVIFVVEKLREVSPGFQLAVDGRSGDDVEDRLPWLPPAERREPTPADDGAAASPVLPGLRRGLAFSSVDEAAGSGYEVARGYSDIIDDGSKCTVVWIDGRPDAYETAVLLHEAGLSVVGFHDDWSKGASSAGEEAMDYISGSLVERAEHLIAVVVNNAPTHKQLLRDVARFCESMSRPLPFFAACSARGKMEDFDGLSLQFISKDRVEVQSAIVEAFERRKQGQS